jgi:hypothetical protein
VCVGVESSMRGQTQGRHKGKGTRQKRVTSEASGELNLFAVCHWLMMEAKKGRDKVCGGLNAAHMMDGGTYPLHGFC